MIISLLTGLLAYYKYDENSGTTVGDSAGANTGTYNGTGTPWGPGIINSGGNFTRANINYVLSTIASGLSGSFTFNCWFKATAAIIGQNAQATLMNSRNMANDNHWGILQIDGNNNYIDGFVYDGTSQTTIYGTVNELVAGTFYMATLVRDTSQGKVFLYLNGTANATPVTDVAANISTYSDFTMGATHNGGAYIDAHDGIIDEGALWSRAVDASEVPQLWNNGLGLQPPFILSNSLFLSFPNTNFREQVKIIGY